MDKKAMLGHKVRRLRREHNLTQAEMAEQLGISPSYLNLIEHNQRPVTVPFLLKLGQVFEVDLQNFAEDEEARLVAGLREVFGDPMFEGSDLGVQDIRELANLPPALGHAVVALYNAYRARDEDLRGLAERMADRDQLQVLQSSVFPLDEVRDFFHEHANHFPELETAAEELWADAGLEIGDLYRGLADTLERVHNLRVKLMPVDVMGAAIRRFDRHNRRILISEMLPPDGRHFQLACQLAFMQHGELIDRVIAREDFSTDEARKLARLGLGNYFAGAVMMPYDRFLDSARAVRCDIEILEHRFGASFEQVCHRLTTLQRPG
ncbi:MAG: ImmA/IrrE family metallo-endopeptidase, partial [Alphaproteobacteria bacterium]